VGFGGMKLERLTLVVLIAILLLSSTVVVIAAERTIHEVSEKESIIHGTSEKEFAAHQQIENNTSATQKVSEGTKEATAKAKVGTLEEVPDPKMSKPINLESKKQPGFDFAFAAIGVFAMALIILSKRRQ
jgi:hypothetical protein